MAKCKKDEIWDNEIDDCRVATRAEKFKILEWKGAKDVAAKHGIMTGAMKGAAAYEIARGVSKKEGSFAAALGSTLVGALYGRHKDIKTQREESTPPYTDVPSRKIPKGKKRKKK